MYFRYYELANRRLDKYLKSAVSQCTSTSNMVNALKQCSNYHCATFIILIDHGEWYSGWKCHSRWYAKCTQRLFKWTWGHLYHTYWPPRMILSLKKSLLVICKMLWLFVNTFTVDDKYSPLNRDNLMQPIQQQLFQK